MLMVVSSMPTEASRDEARPADRTSAPTRVSVAPSVASLRGCHAFSHTRIRTLSKRQFRLHRSSRWSLAALALVASTCLAWTLWLMLLTYAPNAIVNRMMRTTYLDEGSFWRFIEPPLDRLVVGLGGLGAVVITYVYIIARVTLLRHQRFIGWNAVVIRTRHVARFVSRLRHRVDRIAAAPDGAGDVNEKHMSAGVIVTRQLASVVRDLVTEESSTRKHVVRTERW